MLLVKGFTCELLVLGSVVQWKNKYIRGRSQTSFFPCGLAQLCGLHMKPTSMSNTVIPVIVLKCYVAKEQGKCNVRL